MLKIETERPIAIFDLDGVIIQNPPESLGQNTITDGNYWAKHWKDPQGGTLNEEMVDLAASMLLTDTHVIFLTARPEVYRPWTIELLRRAGFHIGDQTALTQRSFAPRLVMLPGGDVPQSSAKWKRDTIKNWLDQGARILFMVEDYRPNAEFVRELIPVLLYERKKKSQYI